MKAYQKIFLILIIVFFLMGQLAFAGQVEKRGKFRLDNDKVIVNEREIIKLGKESQVVNIQGIKIPHERLNNACEIVIEIDENGLVKRIIILE